MSPPTYYKSAKISKIELPSKVSSVAPIASPHHTPHTTSLIHRANLVAPRTVVWRGQAGPMNKANTPQPIILFYLGSHDAALFGSASNRRQVKPPDPFDSVD